MIILDNFSYKIKDRLILKNANLEINDDDCIGIIGKSGCGKSCLLNTLCGIDNVGIKTGTYFKGNVSYMQQNSLLYPWLNIEDNLKFVLKNNKNICVDDILKSVDLLSKKYSFPSKLSGGEKQRVSLARAILMNGEIMFFDEPFSMIDYITKQNLYMLFKDVVKNKKSIIVTHDVDEALNLCNKIFVFCNNELVQYKIKNNEADKSNIINILNGGNNE